MKSFLQSKLYANFWLFIIKSALVVGFVPTFFALLWALFDNSQKSVDFAMFSIIFIYGCGFGLIAGILGYIINYILLRFKFLGTSNWLVGLVGVLLTFFTLNQLNANSLSIPPLTGESAIALFPILICIFLFIKFTNQHIRPYV